MSEGKGLRVMNMNKGGFKMKYIIGLVALTALATTTGCFRMGNLFGNGNGSNTGQSIPPGSEGPAVAVMEGSQALQSFAKMTGTTISNTTLNDYKSFGQNLPISGQQASSNFNQATLQSFAEVGAAACRDAASQAGPAAKLFPGIYFNNGAITQWLPGPTLTNVENAQCQAFLLQSPCPSDLAASLNTLASACESNVFALNTKDGNGKTVTLSLQNQDIGVCLCTGIIAQPVALSH